MNLRRKKREGSPFKFILAVISVFFLSAVLIASVPGQDEKKEANSDSATYRITDSHSLRFYKTTEPNNGKISVLAKGAVMVDGTDEVVGEGLGFGGVVVNYAGKTYFSNNSEVEFHDKSVKKIFHMDTEEFGKPYNTTFIATPPIGSVSVTYNMENEILNVKIDVSNLPRNSTLIVVNEQSGTRYSKYADAGGNTTYVNFSWKQLFSRENYLLDENNKGFGIEYTTELRAISKLYLGREVEPEGFDWAGLDLELEVSRLGRNEISYNVIFAE